MRGRLCSCLGAGHDLVFPPSPFRAAMEKEAPQARQVTVGQEESR